MPVSSSKGLSNPTQVSGNSLNSSFDPVALEGFDLLWSFFPLGYWPDSVIQKWGWGHNLVLGQTPIFTSSIVSLCAHLSFRFKRSCLYSSSLCSAQQNILCNIYQAKENILCNITKQMRTFCVISQAFLK